MPRITVKCVGTPAVLALVVSAAFAQSALPPSSEVKRLEYVSYSSGHVSAISSAPSPGGACASYCCGGGWSRTQYSLYFRANGNDSTVFQGLDYGLFSGFRSKQSLRDIMNLKPEARLKLTEYDRISRGSTLLSNIGGGLLGCSILSLVGLVTVNSQLLGGNGQANLTFLWVSIGSCVAGGGFLGASEYQNAVACQKILDAVSEFNK